MRVLRVFYILCKKNVRRRYLARYNIGVRSIKQVEWIWREHLSRRGGDIEQD